MNQHILFRIAIDLALAACVFFGWWYAALPIGIIAAFRFSYYIELVAAGFAYDALFGMGAGIGFISGYIGTLAAALASAAIVFIKGSIR